MKPIPAARTSKPIMRFASLFFVGMCALAAPTTQVLPQPPVRFEQHPGYNGHKRAIQWSARGLGYSLAFTADATMFRLGDRTLSMRLLGADPHATFEAVAPYSIPTEYFTPAYRGSVQAYRRLRRHQVYPGVDVVFYGAGRSLEYDFEIAPEADSSRIRLRFSGADRLHVDLNGDLQVELAGQTITQHLPVVYQVTASGDRTPVHAEYRLEANHDVSFRLDRYNRSAPLVIDPVISFAAYLQGSKSDAGIAITHDAQGFIYLAGNTSSTDFNTTASGFSQTNAATQNVWVMKLNPTAPPDQVIVYSTFYGGTAVDSVKGIAIQANGLICITGTTTSTDLATTATALQAANAGTTDGFVAAFNPAQSGVASLFYGTYLGGAAVDEPAGIATFNGKIYVTGSTLSDNFPVANSIFPGRAGGRDIFVAELDPTLSGTASLISGTYFGGTGTEYGRSIAVDATGLVYVAGFTYSADIPVTATTAYQPTSAGAGEAFLVQFNLSLPLILYSTYLGGSGVDDARSVLVDPGGKVALAGYTSSANFPVTQNALQPLLGAAHATNAFLALLDLTLPAPQTLVYSTYFGGSVAEVAQDLATDSNGKYILGGYSYSTDLPVSQNTVNPISADGGLNGFVAVIDTTVPPLNSLVYASYITGPGSQTVNGVDIDASGAIYLTGYATSDIFPAGQQTHVSGPGNADAYLFILTP